MKLQTAIIIGIAFVIAVSPTVSSGQVLLEPMVVASIHDQLYDGQGDTFNSEPFEGLLRTQKDNRADRAIVEFDLAEHFGQRVSEARLRFRLSVNNSGGNADRSFNVLVYPGNGERDLEDYSCPAEHVSVVSFRVPDHHRDFDINVTKLVQSFLERDDRYFGLRIEPIEDSSFPSILHKCCLSLNAGKQEIEIWPGDLPAGSVQLDPDRVAQLKSELTEERIRFVDRATLTIYPAPEETANGCAVIICPGGGYNILAWPKEGLEVAEWFNTIGVTAFVLKYRVPRRIPDRIHWEPMQDVQRAIRVVRAGAKKYNVDPNRIGTLGFSAGGHLTVMSGVQYETECYDRVDEADDLSCRPDFICPIYAAYLGDDYDDRKSAKLGPLVTVTEETPPTFMAVTWDDAMRGAQSATLFATLREHGVPAELHAYSKGGHGYGMRPSENPISEWNQHLHAWLKVSGFLTK